jgi:predicted transcriptional regulator
MIEHVHVTKDCPIEQPSGFVKVSDEDIANQLTTAYSGKFLNNGEIILMNLCGGNLIIKAVVVNIEGKISSQAFGVLSSEV